MCNFSRFKIRRGGGGGESYGYDENYSRPNEKFRESFLELVKKQKIKLQIDQNIDEMPRRPLRLKGGGQGTTTILGISECSKRQKDWKVRLTRKTWLALPPPDRSKQRGGEAGKERKERRDDGGGSGGYVIKGRDGGDGSLADSSWWRLAWPQRKAFGHRARVGSSSRRRRRRRKMGEGEDGSGRMVSGPNG